jgi:hypothetical protein
MVRGEVAVDGGGVKAPGKLLKPWCPGGNLLP